MADKWQRLATPPGVLHPLPLLTWPLIPLHRRWGGSCGGEGERQYDKNEIEGEKGLGAQELLEINNV
jgi:hypothetical protein